MVSHVAASGAAITGNGLPHAAATATEAAAPEATEATTTAARRIAGTATHGYDAMREAAMAAFEKTWRRE
jgi:predicted RNA-binding protein associated with RNAse of E/G family